jgi:hypothetical protein
MLLCCPRLRLALTHGKRFLILVVLVKRLLVKIFISHRWVKRFSKLIKFIAGTAIPDADEAIPELWGKSIQGINNKVIVFKRRYTSIRSKIFNFGLKSSFVFLQK